MKKVNPNYLARLVAEDFANHPVIIQEGNRKPEINGHGYYHTNKSGGIVHHPSAYGYPTIYHPSTIHVTVGKKWLYQHRGAKYHRSSDGTLCVLMPKKYHVKIHGFKLIPGFTRENGKIWLIQGNGREHHVSRHGVNARTALKWAIKAWKKQRELNRKEEEFKNNVKEIYVRFEDSLNAGNCEIGTSQWINRHKLEKGKKYRADFVLDEGRKNGSYGYVKRTVQVAIERNEEETQLGYCLI